MGNLYIRGAGGQNDNVGVTTFSGAVNVTAAITADDFRTDSSNLFFVNQVGVPFTQKRFKH